MKHKKAFSFVELIIVVSILALISVVVYSVNNTVKQKTINTRVVADIQTLSNGLEVYQADREKLPLPDGNKNFFDAKGNYQHNDFSSENTFGVYGKITETTLPKKYLDVTPLDPRTKNYYSYGITKKGDEFEVAGVNQVGDSFQARVFGNYKAENGLIGLIREYNGLDFVTDGSPNLPYNPYEKKLIATDQNGNIYELGDTITTGAGQERELYFSDGSISKIMENSSLTLTKMDFPKENNLVSKIELTLNAGVIWTKATRLLGGNGGENESEFEIYTADTTAAVRGTIFKVEKVGATKVGVYKGEVVVSLNTGPKKVEAGTSIEIQQQSEIQKTNVSPEIPPFKQVKNAKDISPIQTTNKEKKELIKQSKVVYFDGTAYQDGETFEGYSSGGGGGGATNCIPMNLYASGGVIYKKTGDNIEEKPVEYKYSTCCLYPDEDGQCVRGDESLLKKGYKLVAYAPYDKPKWSGDLLEESSFRMYSNTGNIDIITVSDTMKKLSHFCNAATGKSIKTSEITKENCAKLKLSNTTGVQKIKPQKGGNFYRVGDTVGVFLNTQTGSVSSPPATVGGQNYLKYNLSQLNLGDDFVIEMRVRGLKRTTAGKYYLFDEGKKLRVFLNKNGNIQIYSKKDSGNNKNFTNYSGNEEQNSTGSLNITDNNFHTITTKVENKKLTVFVDGEEINMSFDTFQQTPKIEDDLFIGAYKSSSYENRWNDIIDYVKIYKKD